MVAREVIQENLNNCLICTGFLNLSNLKRGKVRDSYDLGDKLIIITTDRQSAFDRVLASVPFKGQVLNQVSAHWFELTEGIVPNHVIAVPDPNVTIARKCEVIPIEFVVRAHLTGSTETSAWTKYARGERDICGNILPEGLVKNQKFDRPILTPTTKAESHDESISVKEIIERGIINQWAINRLEHISFALFRLGAEVAAANGLILVDTKYEFGWDENGAITLIDEIHTPDSSRFWLANTYAERFGNGQEPENIDKEFLRLWFKDNCDPYNDSRLPEAPEELVVELSSRYIRLYEMITGRDFVVHPGSIKDRLNENLAKYM